MRNSDSKLGDKFPDSRNVKWGAMKAGASHLSEEWHDLIPSDPKMSEKWVDQKPSAPQMSEKWTDLETLGSEFSDKWASMEQGGRKDPYSMFPSAGDRTQPAAKGKSTKAEGAGKYERSTQHTEFGSTREI